MKDRTLFPAVLAALLLALPPCAARAAGRDSVPWQLHGPRDVKCDRGTVESLRADDARARKIARNGRDFVEKHLTLAHVRRYWLDLLRDYASLQRFEPQRDPSLILIHGN